MSTNNTNTPRTITKINDANDSFNATNVETNELVEGGELLSETIEVVEDNSPIGGPDGQIITRVYSDDVATRRVNGEVRAIITRA